MINRVLIRIKILQILYAFYQNGDKDWKVAENELLLSLRRSYDLYYYFLLLIVEVTRLEERRLDARKHKYRPTHSDLNPNTRLIQNRFAQQLELNTQLLNYAKEHGVSWQQETTFVKSICDRVLASDLYHEYLNNPNDSYETDREFWRAVFRNLVCGDESVEEALEDICIYWNDDVDIIETFVIKTIKRFDEANGAEQPLLPMFKDQEDYEFVLTLFRQTILCETDYKERITRHMKNWETERAAPMDMIIMQVALTELLHFPNIPVSVTLNEYIDAAKCYSTPKSSVFINGVLDSVVKELKNEHLLQKNV